MRCNSTTNHQPEGYPWSIHARCTQPSGHHTKEGADRVHRERVEGHLILWLE